MVRISLSWRKDRLKRQPAPHVGDRAMSALLWTFGVLASVGCGGGATFESPCEEATQSYPVNSNPGIKLISARARHVQIFKMDLGK